MYTVPIKKTNMFFVISPIKLGRCIRNLIHCFLQINVLQNYVNVFHLT